MQQRPSSRLLVINRHHHLLLFRFEHKAGPLGGQAFWATPGGALDEGESYEEAAHRELFEEVGLKVEDVGRQVAQRTARFAVPSGALVVADERYFLIQLDELAVSNANWTQLEHEVMTAHHWWSQSELQRTSEQIWPEDLEGILIDAGIWRPAQ
jgi:8-oxo-dGTP pyrophosphatase MutT (NUDIX family)